jgi:hypothetical protein
VDSRALFAGREKVRAWRPRSPEKQQRRDESADRRPKINPSGAFSKNSAVDHQSFSSDFGRLGWMITRRLQLLGLVGLLVCFSSCSTVTEMLESNMPERHTGRASIVVDLSEQEAYLYRGKHLVATSRISSGREGYRTPTGHFEVIRKDIDHHSSVYGSYVDAGGNVVRAGVDRRKDRRPPRTHFEGAPMPFFLEFSPAYGLHQGYLPGVPASHGCIRMPYWKARQFYNTARIGTPVIVKH